MAVMYLDNINMESDTNIKKSLLPYELHFICRRKIYDLFLIAAVMHSKV